MNLISHLAKLAWKQMTRHRVRSLLTILGVAAGMFLYAAVETMQQSLSKATEAKAKDTTLVVYRENRYCPSTSRLPEHYQAEIERIDGVSEAIPIQIVVNNCGASLDVIAFRGVPPEDLRRFNPAAEIMDGSFDAWANRGDGALLGEHFAKRRNLKPGDQFEAVGVRVWVAGILRSGELEDNNVAYVHLPFLQQASRIGLGTVTQFNVRVDSPDQLEAVAEKIDTLFSADAAPTSTRPEKAFFAQTAKDMIEMIRFTRWLAYGAVLAVLALVANALLLVVRGGEKENAILQTVGFSRKAVGGLVLWEGALLGLAGGLVGCLAAFGFFRWKQFTLGNEGVTLALSPSLEVTLYGLAVALALGIGASVWPAILAAKKPIVESLRAA
ncbi:MAG: ABC transporter permease [Verrucomicrobiota bacterium]